MLYNGINIDVNAAQHEVVTDFIRNLDSNHDFTFSKPRGSHGVNVEIWWDTVDDDHPYFSGIDGNSIKTRTGERNVVTVNSYDAKSPDDFINAFNHWKEHGVLDSEVFK
uniref:Uncharacterized protein n=1 Tax=Acinetobacter phage vB_Ab_1137_KEN_05 TaxID=3143020 RepID=A0AAU8KY93_9VIRU